MQLVSSLQKEKKLSFCQVGASEIDAAKREVKVDLSKGETKV